MDFLNYKPYWDDDGKLPKRRIAVRTMRYDVGMGAHPYGLSGDSAVFDGPGFVGRVEGVRGVHEQWQSDPRGTIDGHNVMRDDNLTSLLEVDPEVPLSPVFVRDLAGRIVYTGYGPERKSLEEWDAYNATARGADGNLKNPWVPLVAFPRKCDVVDERVDGADLLEQVFLTKFRTLDMGRGYVGRPSGAPEDLVSNGFYALANLYPYKYRLDTFYVDGWRLPQVQMLYAKQSGVNFTDAAFVGRKMVEAFERRADKAQRYEDWLEAQGGAGGSAAYLESMFAQGCTVIPTLEACNGINVVDREFNLVDFWPGRAVTGLHEVVKRVPNKAPANTIVEVVEPGYVTAKTIVRAKVVVSDGSGYVSPNVADPLPLIPNLHMPHSRTLPNWEATWIPTHPEHFEVPHLWGWDLNTGRFLQLNGPIWDPLHYWYESTALVYEAVKTPLDDNRWLAKVPERMKERFYPVVPRQGFDVVSFEALERRRARGSAPMSAVTRVPAQFMSADIGYHPLPPEFEYELDSFWFPEFHPRNREHGLCPDELKNRICPIITPKVSVEAYARAIPEQKEAPWLSGKQYLVEPSDKALENYPFLTRYIIGDMSPEELADLVPLPFLGHVDDAVMSLPTHKVWAGYDEFDALEGLVPGLYDAVWDYRERALELMRFRHMVYQMTPGIYKLGWWFGASLEELQLMFAEWYL
ncbi:MAG: hypothetical protein WAZ18_00805, partial [Alphaproteobacteria bacterium]